MTSQKPRQHQDHSEKIHWLLSSLWCQGGDHILVARSARSQSSRQWRLLGMKRWCRRICRVSAWMQPSYLPRLCAYLGHPYNNNIKNKTTVIFIGLQPLYDHYRCRRKKVALSFVSVYLFAVWHVCHQLNITQRTSQNDMHGSRNNDGLLVLGPDTEIFLQEFICWVLLLSIYHWH